MRRPFPAFCVLLIAACSATGEGDPEKKRRPAPTDDPLFTDTASDGPDQLPEVPLPEAQVVINELMARNDSTWTAPEGDRPDWVELVNVGDETIDLRRLTLTDLQGNTWDDASGQLAAGERLLLSSTELGFSLSSAEDTLTLFADGEVIDEIDFVELERDIALARIPDLTGELVRTAWPTPGDVNHAVASSTLDAATETVFLAHEVHRLDLTLTPQAYNRLNTRVENWAQASLTLDGQTFPAIGLRLKGSASFDLMDGKPAFKVDLNRGVPGTRFRTLKGFNLHNGNVYDPTRTRDHLSYSLAREAGLMAPRVGWADVYVNGNPYGIYMIIEQHDDQMIEANFPGLGETGFLFEPNESSGNGWGWGDFGNGDVSTWDMEEGTIPPPPEIIDALNRSDRLVASRATDAAVEELWTVVDQDSLLSYMAWESVVSHTDGYKAPNNWRVFVHPVDAKVHLVPAGAEWTWDNPPFSLIWGGRMASWCLQNPGCRRAYGQRALEVANLADQMDLQQEFMDVSTMLGPYIAADNRSPHGNATVNSQRQSTYRNLASYPRQVRDQICGDMPELDGCP